MEYAKPLPADLAANYHNWHKGDYENAKARFFDLVDNGQHPRAMVISCCDSRVNVTALLDGHEGDFFIHRNIANFVPAYQPEGDHHGTSAALEYGVTALGVGHLIIVGHSHCGGIKGCHDMCSGKNEALRAKTSFVGRWVDGLRPAYERLATTDLADDLHAHEREGVLLSLEHAMTFPFIKQAVDKGELSLHGLWHDIRAGELHCYDAKSNRFEPV